MKIQTQNKLAHLQCEYNTLYAQPCMLQSQEKPLLEEIQSCQQFITYNQGDRSARARYKSLMQRHRTLVSQINRNATRLNKLQMSINQEVFRLNGGTIPRRRY